MSIQSGNVIPISEGAGGASQTARVVSVNDRDVHVRIREAIRPARTAFSCLIQPEPDDLVLITQNEDGAFYILGIIERKNGREMTLSFPGDVNLHADNGACRVRSGKSITLAALEKLTCFSDQAIYKGREAVCSFEDVTATAANFHGSFRTFRLIGQLINTMARHVIEKAKNYIRFTEDDDQVRAGQMTRKTDGLYSMDSRHTVMVSKKDTKIDGERIHMG